MGWTKLSVPRLRFARIGNDETLDWSNVRGVKFIYNSLPGSTGWIGLDDLFVTAGADGAALTGTFRARYKFVFNDGTFTDESLPSPVSDKIGLSAEALKVTIPRQSALAMDTQTNYIWLYIWSQAMGAYYRTINPISLNRAKKTFNEFGPFEPNGAIDADDRIRILTIGRCVGRRYIPGTDPVSVATISSSGPPVNKVIPGTVTSVAYSYGDGYTYSALGGSVFPSLQWPGWPTSSGAETGATFNVSPIASEAATINSVTFVCQVRVNASGDWLGQVNVGYYSICRVGSTVYHNTLTVQDRSIANTWTITHGWTVNPATSAAWTVNERNNATFGIAWAAGYDKSKENAYIQTSVWGSGNADPYIEDDYDTAGSSGSSSISRSALSFRIQTSEAELLLRNDKLQTGRNNVPDNIIAIVGSHFERTLCLTSDYLYISDPGHPSRYPIFQSIKVSDGVNEVNYWMEKASGSVYIGTNKDIYRLDGDLTELPDGTLSASLKALNIGSPPVDAALAREGNALVYRASDGPRALIGEVSQPLRGSLDLLLQGQTRAGIQPIAIMGRHRLAMSANYLYWVTSPQSAPARASVGEWLGDPDGEINASDRRRIGTVGRGGVYSTAVYRYSFADGKWYRQIYQRVIRSITRALDGSIYAGTTSGEVAKLNTGTTDFGTTIPAVFRSTIQDAGDPLSRKVPFDLSIRADTGGLPATASLYLNDATTAAVSFSFTTSSDLVYKRSLAALPVFRRAQLRLTGSFNSLKLYEWNLSFRAMPQHHYYLDTGNVHTNFEYYRWFREIQILAKSPVDLTVEVWFDDVQLSTNKVSVQPDVTATYIIPLGRNVRGRQPRVVVTTTSDPATSEAGFELYWVKWKMRPSGNQSEKTFVQWSAKDK